MGNLLNIYEQMEKQAELEKVSSERKEVLVKYASVAEEMLEKEHGDAYTAEDVEKLAAQLIEHDIELQNQQEKIAEYGDIGRVMARSFMDELRKAGKDE